VTYKRTLPFPKDINEHLMAYGINDSAIYLDDKSEVTPITEFEENTTKMISMINKYNVNMVFVGLTMVNEALAGNFNDRLCFSNERIHDYNQSLKRICSEHHIDFMDLHNECNNEKTIFLDMLQDGLHPDGNGHSFIMQKLKEIGNLL
ncbi:MAG: GDSL-type esterase/lipase family protein, partial [Firmicutes bacterium]|nr:GDSL-type esterase/lipase family protein [Bacillota bacterium]